MRFLTSKDVIKCPAHQAPYQIKPTGVSKAGAVILTEADLLSAPPCTLPSVPCGPIVRIITSPALKTKFGRKSPVLLSSQIMTGAGAATIQAAGDEAAVFVRAGGQGGGSDGTGAAAKSQEPEKTGEQRKPTEKKKPAPGVYLGDRDLAVTGADRPGTHQFLVLIPEDEGQIPAARRGDLKEIAEGKRGLVASAKNTAENRDLLDEVLARRDHLEAVLNEDSDRAAALQWFDPGFKSARDWHPAVRLRPPPGGLTVDQFIVKVLASFECYLKNLELAPVEYPLLGGVLLRLAGEKCFNSTSWAHGLIEAAGGEEARTEDTDLRGPDLCRENRVPPYYFRDNTDRVHSTKQRRDSLRQQAVAAASRAEALKAVTRAAVDAVANDSSVASKEAMCLEDLRVVLLGEQLTTEEVQTHSDFVRDARFLSLRLKTAAAAMDRHDDFVEAVVAGLCFGYYLEKISRTAAHIGVVFKGAEGHPAAYMEAVDIGAGLAEGSLEIASLPDEMDALVEDLAP